MSRGAVLMLTVAATLLACAGMVLAQATEVGRAKATSSSWQRAETAVIPGRYIVLLDDGGAEQPSAQNGDQKQEARRVADRLSREGKVEKVTHTYGSALLGFAARIYQEDLPEVKNDPRVDAVVADREVHALAQSVPTGVDRVEADLSSTAAGDGSGAVDADIAIIDTGIYARHPDLNVVGGRDCVGRDRRAWGDGNGHGIHVAGSAAARDDTAGVVGTAPGARLWSVKVLNSNASGTASSIICGIDWVTAKASTIEVANMSVGASLKPGAEADDGSCGSSKRNAADATHRAICRSVGAGVAYVVSAGNYAANVSSYYPAAFDEVLTVTSMADFDGRPGGQATSVCGGAQDDRVRSFSNYAGVGTPDEAHIIAAPGVCIESTFFTKWKRGRKVSIKPSFATLSGTSMASPHVTGTAALCIANGHCPTGDPQGTRTRLLEDAEQQSSGDPTVPDYYGFIGDPNTAIPDRYYGFLEYAGGY